MCAQGDMWGSRQALAELCMIDEHLRLMRIVYPFIAPVYQVSLRVRSLRNHSEACAGCIVS
jgi:hypothetical protein